MSNSWARNGVPHQSGLTDYGDMGLPELYGGRGLKPQDLMGMPWRVALALQEDGWWLRSDIIWFKNNPMPESLAGWRWEWHRIKVKKSGKAQTMLTSHGPSEMLQNPGYFQGISPTWLATYTPCPGCPKCLPNDGYVLRRGSWRPTSAYEHIFMLTKSQNYFADGEPVREPHSEISVARADYEKHRQSNTGWKSQVLGSMPANVVRLNPAGRNLRDVWEFSTEPFPDAHFATYPRELVRRCILIGTSEKGVCPKCGAQWARVVERRDVAQKREPAHQPGHTATKVDSSGWESTFGGTLGWRATCPHGALEPTPATILDPFVGSGTTCLVAKELGRYSIGIDLKEDYLKMGIERIRQLFME